MMDTSISTGEFLSIEIRLLTKTGKESSIDGRVVRNGFDDGIGISGYKSASCSTTQTRFLGDRRIGNRDGFGNCNWIGSDEGNSGNQKSGESCEDFHRCF
jgi:hypothetical protein